jgi:hypothetical protein
MLRNVDESITTVFVLVCELHFFYESCRVDERIGTRKILSNMSLQSDCQHHCISTPEAGVIRRNIPHALDNGFSDLFRLAISGV